ncbi:MAG: S8 family serine peptidase [Verrucomicrobia bacterium]|nr:S8 family serine peptidase [Verrucomicrobiota bacterium]
MKRSPFEWLLLALLLVAAATFGWWLMRDAAGARNAADGDQRPTPLTRVVDTVNADTKQGPRLPSKSHLSLEDALLGIPNERLIRFATEEDYRRFLASLDGSGLRLLGRIDQLRAVRLGFDKLSDLDGLLDGAEQFSNFYVTVPDYPDVAAQAGSLGFGDQLLAWLGVTTDNSTWGKGIKIAILDTGVGSHRALPDGILQIDLVSDGELIPLNGHGTAVASLIVGQDGLTRGIAPGSELLSIRIGDESGGSNSFLLAEGIIAAVDSGAQLVNISMGSYGDSAIVRDAIAYANQQGVLIFASSGNEGFDSPAYPAANNNVVAVGAVDAKSDYLAFSNLGSGLNAPGYAINAAWEGDQYTLFSGTSASAPIVTAAVAATATQLGISTAAAYQIVMANLNEAGAPGNDPAYGDGVLNLGRAINSGTPGIYDAAAASNYFVPATAAEPVPSLLVTFQNRGTERLINTPVTVTVPNGTFAYNIGNLPPGGIQTFDTPLYFPTNAESLEVSSQVTLSNGQTDSNPRNNGLSTQIILPTPDEAAP